MSLVAAIPAESAAQTAPAVRAVGLGKEIDGRPILQGISLDIPAGRYVALLGANGAGKSTLLKLLATLTSLSTGDLSLFGEPVGRRNAVALRARIGLIGHQSMLYGELTARENLLFFGRLAEVADPAGRADYLLQLVGLTKRADDPVKAFSRGMVQRAAIARALMHEPALLLADEPFCGLDAPSNWMLEQLLAQLHSGGMSIILAHHDIAQSLRIAQQAVILADGRVVLDEPTGRLDPATAFSRINGRLPWAD